jgi:hypothetical protein
MRPVYGGAVTASRLQLIMTDKNPPLARVVVGKCCFLWKIKDRRHEGRVCFIFYHFISFCLFGGFSS